MTDVRLAWGTATGPTETASYDAALAEAGVHDYNLVHFSSVLPEGTTLDLVGTAPTLGPVGARLQVVEARATARGPTTVSAGLAWATTQSGQGILYEESGETDSETIRDHLDEGIEVGKTLRDWPFEDGGRRVATVDADEDEYATAVVVAAYDEADPV